MLSFVHSAFLVEIENQSSGGPPPIHTYMYVCV